MLVTASEFSRLAGVSRQSIAKLVKTGNLVKRPNGKMDTDHPVNHEYIHRERNKPETANDKRPKGQQLKKPPPESKKLASKNNPPGDSEVDINNCDTRLLSGEFVSGLPKVEFDKVKVFEQISEIRLKNRIKRETLIERNLIRGIFSKKYEIDMASYLTIKDKLMPDIAAIFGVSDPELVMAAGERMDEELWKILNHTKALFDKFLVSIKSEEI